MERTLHIELLGGFCLIDGDTSIAVNSKRLQALLAYLMLHHGAPLSRRQLAFHFWPDSAEAQARTNLRQLLSHLHRVVPDIDLYLYDEGQTLAWRTDRAITSDVASFEAALTRAAAAKRQADEMMVRQALAEAVDLYRGDLAPDCYDDWIQSKRERLRQEYIDSLITLIHLLEEQRAYAHAIEYAQTLLGVDPLHEDAYHTLMHLYALNGNRTEAIQTYRMCAAVLARELGVEPSEGIRRTYERLLVGAAPPVSIAEDRKWSANGETNLVGRKPEWVQLLSAWRAAVAGRAHLVIIRGEAGIGKTRLAEEMRAWAEHQGIATATARAYAAEGRLAYAPVVAWLRTPSLAAARASLSPIWLGELVRLLPELRQERPDLPESKPLLENWQRQHLFEALAKALQSLDAPRLVLLDDIQWCDRETLEWLRYLLRYAPDAPLLIIATQRTEEVTEGHPLLPLLYDLRQAGQAAEIVLAPLDRDETMALATQLSGVQVDGARVDELFRETEGNPLFVVETVRSMEDWGVVMGDGTPYAQRANFPFLPPKVQAVIEARLAQLTPMARELAGLAATVGREFTLELLVRAGERDEPTVIQVFEELWQRRIVRAQPGGRYDFSHDKIREVAYASVNPIRLRLHHLRLATALEKLYSANLNTISSRLAVHYEQAEWPEQAMRYYEQAAQEARRLHAMAEATGYYRRTLSLLADLPDTRRRAEQELVLQTELGACLIATEGYSAREVKQIYTRASDLCEQLGRSVDGPILRALAIANVETGNLQTTYKLGNAIMQAAERTDDQVLRVEGHYVLGVATFWMGNFVSARTYLESAIAHYDPNQHSIHITRYAQDPKVVCLCRLARTLWYLGYPDQAVAQMNHSVALAQVLGHPFSQAYALIHAGTLCLELGDLQQAQKLVNEALLLTDTQGIWVWRRHSIIMQGLLEALHGETTQGIIRMQEGLDTLVNETQTDLVAFLYNWIASALQRANRVDEGLATISQAFGFLAKTDERFCEADLHRIQGELLMMQGAELNVVEACFQTSRKVAREQQARSLELKAAMSLARLWSRQGRVAEARQTLQVVYDWFGEGFETANLQEARTLLQKL